LEEGIHDKVSRRRTANGALHMLKMAETYWTGVQSLFVLGFKTEALLVTAPSVCLPY
jgi:hypothetical protein